MARHIEDMRALLDQEELDAVLICSKAMKRWMGTLTGGGCFVLIAADDMRLLLDGRYITEAREQEHDLVIDLLPSQSSCNLWIRLKELAFQQGWKRIGLEGEATSAETYQTAQQFVEEPVLLTDQMARLRMIKTPDEVIHLQASVELADDVFAAVVPKLRVGMTEHEVSALLQFESVRRGAEKMAFDTIVAAGERTALPHGRPTSREIRYGDNLMLDFGVQYEGYQSDITRNVFFGEPREELSHIYDVVLEAQLAGIAAIALNVDSEDVDRAARFIIEKAGYGQYFNHGLGHGIGVDNDTELPLLRPGKHFRLAEGMCMSCEPGIYIPGLGGIRIEDDVLLKDGYGHPLNQAPKTKIILEG